VSGYRNVRTKNPTEFERKIDDERKRRKILVRCWISQSAGDALKYECDAIEKYKPPLNRKMSRPVQSAKDRMLANDRLKQKYRSMPSLSESSTKQCPGCLNVKLLSEFYKQPTVKGGYGTYCKECAKKKCKDIREKYRMRSEEEIPSCDTLKKCTGCRLDKQLSEFAVSTGSKDGRSSYCRVCFKIKKRESRKQG
jgi:hypothetical protein